MSQILRELRHSARGLLKKPFFSLVILLVLGVSVGANSAIYSIVNGMLLRPYPYDTPDDLVTVWTTYEASGLDQGSFSFTDYAYLKEEGQSFDGVAAYHGLAMDLSGGEGPPVRIEGAKTSANLFEVLGIEPILGRGFEAKDDLPDAAPVVVLSEGLWREKFGSRTDLLGEVAMVSREPREIVGVMPQTADVPSGAKLWVPLALDPQVESPNTTYLRALARLGPGISLTQAEGELDRIAPGLVDRFPDTPAGRGFQAVPLKDERVGPLRPVFMILLAMVGFVLLIACFNITSLFMVRNEERRREIAVRAALGASRWQLTRQLLADSLWLGLGGGLLGLALGSWGVRSLMALVPVEIPAWIRFELDLRVLAMTLAAALASILLVSLFPARQALRLDISNTLQDTGRQGFGGRRSRWLHSTLLVLEVAFSLALLIGAGLMLRSFLELNKVDPGFEVDNLLVYNMDLLPEQCPVCDQRVVLFDALLREYGSVPGVVSVGAVSHLPLTFSAQTTDFTLLGQTYDEYRGNPTVLRNTATPGYFEALGIPLLEGRPMPEEVVALPTFQQLGVVVNQAMAERVWPNESAVGQRIKLGDPDDQEAPWLEVFGVVGNTKHFGLDKGINPTIYVPFKQVQSIQMTFVAKTGLTPEQVIPSLRDATQRVLPDLAIYEVQTMEGLLEGSLWQQRLFTIQFWVFAAIALVLAMGGLYGMMSYAVSRRTNEIGIRMALGARPSRLVRMVLHSGFRLTVIGLVIGLGLGFALSQGIASMLYGIAPSDPTTYVALAILLTVVALTACGIPAWRATRVDPLEALRHD